MQFKGYNSSERKDATMEHANEFKHYFDKICPLTAASALKTYNKTFRKVLLPKWNKNL